MPRIITGLDIGSAYVKAVVAEQAKDGSLVLLSAIRQPAAGFRRGVLVDAEEARTMFLEVADALRQVSHSAVRNAYVNVSGEQTKVRVSRGIAAVGQPDHEIRQEDIDRAIQSSKAAKMLPNYKVLHTMIREFLVDDVGDVTVPVGMTGSRLEVSTLLVEGFAPHLDALVNGLQDAGIGLLGVIFNPFAAARAVLSKRQRELGAIVIDFGAATTCIAAYEESKPLYAKALPIGSDFITHDIAIGLRVPIAVAEKLKEEFGVVSSKLISRRDVLRLADFDPALTGEVPRRFLAEIIQARVAQITEIINNELKALKGRFQFPAGIVATGGGVRLEGFPAVLKDELRLPVQVGLPDVAALEVANPAYEQLVDSPDFSTAAGLLQIGFEEHAPAPRDFFGSLRRVVSNILP